MSSTNIGWDSDRVRGHCRPGLCERQMDRYLPTSHEDSYEALPGVLGIQGEGFFIFMDLGRRVIYVQGFGENDNFLGF